MKTKKIWAVMLFVLFCLSFSAEAGYVDRVVVFFDDFTSNKNKWATENSENASFAFSGGFYHFSHLSDSSSWHTFTPVGIDQTKNFEIETSIKKSGGVDNNGHGLIWGRQDQQNQFEFQITGDGHFRIKKYVQGAPHDFLGWQTTSAIHKGNGAVNKLTILKNQNRLNFLINDVNVHSMEFQPFMGNGVGYVIYSRQDIAIDYLKIVNGRMETLGDILRGKTGTPVFDDEFNDNGNSWPLENSETAVFAIKDGLFYFEHLRTDRGWNAFKAIDLRESDDFGIETVIKKIEGITNNGFGLIWGRKDSNNQFEFQISANGYLRIKKYVEGREVDLMPWRSTGAINQGNGASNKLYLLRQGSLLRFFINDVEVHSTAFEPFMGNEIGYMIYQNQRIAVDYLRISYLEDSRKKAPDDFMVAGKEGMQTVKPVQMPGVESHGKGLALVIGNAIYLHGGSLGNPENDAEAMEKVLTGLGFSVLKFKNLSQSEMKRAIDDFGRKLKDSGVGLFFYAGHGLQVNGNNYLIPVDAKLESENDAEYDCVRADRVLAKMEAAGTRTNIVILDACRDNPFERSWHRGARGNGLAFMQAPSGSLIAYATSPGQTASDGLGGVNGIYTSAVLKHIGTPNISILQMFQRVRSTVMEMTEKRQIPWESTSLTGDYFFKR